MTDVWNSSFGVILCFPLKVGRLHYLVIFTVLQWRIRRTETRRMPMKRKRRSEKPAAEVNAAGVETEPEVVDRQRPVKVEVVEVAIHPLVRLHLSRHLHRADGNNAKLGRPLPIINCKRWKRVSNVRNTSAFKTDSNWPPNSAWPILKSKRGTKIAGKNQWKDEKSIRLKTKSISQVSWSTIRLILDNF